MRWFAIIIACLLLTPWTARAAEFYFGSDVTEVAAGNRFEVGVLLSTQGQSVSAVEGLVTFPEDNLELLEIRDGNSAINFWLESPQAVNGSVRFAGFTPGGFVRTDALLFTLVFAAQGSSSEAIISTLDTRVLLNDGQGTAAVAATSPFTFVILESSGPDTYVPPRDTVPPETFVPVLSRDPDVHANAWVLVFATQDKGVGLDHYEVREIRPWWDAQRWLSLSDWTRSDSPYVLQDQKLHSRLAVKAIDKAGNERLAQLEAPTAWYVPQTLESWGILAAILLMMAISIILTFGRLWRKPRGRFHS